MSEDKSKGPESNADQAPVHRVVMPTSLYAWIESVSGPVVLVVQPRSVGIGDFYAPHARYFDSEDQASEWYELNRKMLQYCIVARYPVVDGRSA